MDKERWNAALEKMAVYERRSAALAGQLEKKYCSGPPKGKLELEHDRKLAGIRALLSEGRTLPLRGEDCLKAQ